MKSTNQPIRKTINKRYIILVKSLIPYHDVSAYGHMHFNYLYLEESCIYSDVCAALLDVSACFKNKYIS
jgi:hypothetical protein